MVIAVYVSPARAVNVKHRARSAGFTRSAPAHVVRIYEEARSPRAGLHTWVPVAPGLAGLVNPPRSS